MSMSAISAWIQEHRAEYLAELDALCRFESVRQAPEEGAPFGRPAADALHYALALAERYGLTTENIDNYAGSADLGPGAPQLGILAHLDVVPVGTGWSVPSFGATVCGDTVVGRGVIDDKGPALAALFAMRAIKELELPLKAGVRLILGTDEECGSSDMEYYAAHRAFPPQVFTPDGSYPVINIEKGRAYPLFTAPADDRILDICGGIVGNAVPGSADALVSGIAACDVPACVCGLPVTAEAEEGGVRIRVTGVSAHASLPEKGQNALTALLTLLCDLLPEARGVCALRDCFPYGEWDGTSAGVACCDEASGPLTLVFSLLQRKGDVLVGQADIRFPVCTSHEEVAVALADTLSAHGLTLTDVPGCEPHCVDENSPFVQTLLRVFEEQTGQSARCIAIGGGTYVHEIEGGVAFGAEFDGSEYNMHGVDEQVPIDELMADIRIQAAAILALCGA